MGFQCVPPEARFVIAATASLSQGLWIRETRTCLEHGRTPQSDDHRERDSVSKTKRRRMRDLGRAGKMAQWVKVLTSKSGDLSSMPRILFKVGEN